MTPEEYNALDNFPRKFVSIIKYEADGFRLKSGAIFTGTGKVTLGKDDFSIVDAHGHPHHFSGCNLLYKDE